MVDEDSTRTTEPFFSEDLLISCLQPMVEHLSPSSAWSISMLNSRFRRLIRSSYKNKGKIWGVETVIKEGHVDLLKWLASTAPRGDTIKTWSLSFEGPTSMLCNLATKYKRREILGWLMDNNCIWTHVTCNFGSELFKCSSCISEYEQYLGATSLETHKRKRLQFFDIS